jgi:hypothetical protein
MFLLLVLLALLPGRAGGLVDSTELPKTGLVDKVAEERPRQLASAFG